MDNANLDLTLELKLNEDWSAILGNDNDAGASSDFVGFGSEEMSYDFQDFEDEGMEWGKYDKDEKEKEEMKMVDPKTLDAPIAAPPLQFPVVTVAENVPSGDGNWLTEVESFKAFGQNGGLIVDAFMAAGIPIPPETTTVAFESAMIPSLAPSNGRRKSSIRQRNVEELNPPKASPALNQDAVEAKPLKPLAKKRNASGKIKMHQLDPAVYPKAKGAVYSEHNREKKKMELEKATKLNEHFRGRINFRDGIISQLLTASEVAELQREDKRLEDSIVQSVEEKYAKKREDKIKRNS